ncbi:MAG: hypothetical protein KDD42_06895 [Bdellovibrionales bacterium]|nr:hypothetical protein [Bdellovibrionales bacterium]
MPNGPENNWGYPTCDTTDRPKIVQSVQPHEPAQTRPVKSGRLWWGLLSVSFSSLCLTAFISWSSHQPPGKDLLKQLIYKTEELLSVGTSTSSQLPYPDYSISYTNEQPPKELWNCNGVYTDAPSPSGICSSVTASQVEGNRGEQFITRPWTKFSGR